MATGTSRVERGRARLAEIIYGIDTPEGKAFDVVLLWCIVLSIVAVALETVQSIATVWGPVLRAVEWFFTILFTVEYGLWLLVARRPLRYARSFFGIVDLLAIVPTYLSLVVTGSQSLLVIRALRLLRLFRVLKLARYVEEADLLLRALRSSFRKIAVFVGTVATAVLVVGALMYLIEGEEGGFTSIPRSVYWAVVTITTVGYGDIAPRTPLGQLLAAALMLLGYGLIAVPTGVFSVELAQARMQPRPSSPCGRCGATEHERDARFCRHCGGALAVSSPLPGAPPRRDAR